MKTIKIKTETISEAIIGDKPVNEVLSEIAGLCHDRLRYSTSKQERCEMLCEDGEYKDYGHEMEDRVLALEGALCQILDLLED